MTIFVYSTWHLFRVGVKRLGPPSARQEITRPRDLSDETDTFDILSCDGSSMSRKSSHLFLKFFLAVPNFPS
jgi:hypothetical protein